jgi:hypothetical protein
MDIKFYAAQGIGFIGMALVFFAFQQKEKRRILIIQALAAAVFCVHFLLLGAFTGMAMNMLEVPRNAVFASVKKYQRITAAVFSAVFIILGIVTWENPLSFFPVIAMCISSFVFSFQNPRDIRFCSVFVSLLWIIYNIAAFSVAGILTEGFCLLSIIIAVIRYDIKKSG